MTFEETKLKDVFIINNFSASDDRGQFVKTFNKNALEEANIGFEIRESYFSISKKGVIRGMHFQLPPFDHEKLVYVAKGAIMDVVIDLRKSSPTYKEFISVELSEHNKKSIIIPKGLAHGFKSLLDDTITVYNVATEHNPNSDMGVRYDSFDHNWDVTEPVVSQRDTNFIHLDTFCRNNPF